MAYIGRTPVVGNFVKLDAITTSATATYNLLNGGVAYYPQSANNCIVSLNGVIQSPTSAYTISGSTIVFSDALTSSDTIDFILVLGDVLNIGTPSDATVGFAKVTSNLITGATAETSIDGADSLLIYDDSASALRKMTRTNFVSGIGGTNTPAFHVYRSTNQTISNTTFTKVQYDTKLIDTDSAFDNSTNYKFTVPSGKSGRYVLGFSNRYNSGTSFSAHVYLYVNATNVSSTSYTNGYYTQSGNVIILDLTAGDTAHVEVWQNVGGDMDVSGVRYYSYFYGFKLI